MSPTAATQAGYHEHNGASLDDALDDFSAAGPNGLDAQRRFIDGISQRIARLNIAALDKEQQADLQIVKNNLGLQALELDTIQSYKHNPTVYVELAGQRLVQPLRAELRAPRSPLPAHHQTPGEDARALRAGEGESRGCAGGLEPRRARRERGQHRPDRSHPAAGGARFAESRLRSGCGQGRGGAERFQRVPEGHVVEQDQ